MKEMQAKAGYVPNATEPAVEEAGTLYRRTIRRLNPIRYVLQDKLIDLKHLQSDIGATETEEAYMRKSIWQGRAGERLNAFDEERIQPLIEKSAITGLDIDGIDEWLWARHVKEANTQLKEINPDRENNDWLSGLSDSDVQQILDKQADNVALQEVGKEVDRINADRVNMVCWNRIQQTHGVQRISTMCPLNVKKPVLYIQQEGKVLIFVERKASAGWAHVDLLKMCLSMLLRNTKPLLSGGDKNRVGQALLEFAKNNNDTIWWRIDE